LTILLAIDSDFIKENAQPDQNLLVKWPLWYPKILASECGSKISVIC